ncbi:hypothetical protein [Desulfosporosinus sp. Sb-LF]|nr:hypothetical protein [Desulfosporosinus sp. Sb-LF]
MTRTGRLRLEHRHGWQGAAHLQNNLEVLRFSLGVKRIAMERVRTG